MNWECPEGLLLPRTRKWANYTAFRGSTLGSQKLEESARIFLGCRGDGLRAEVELH